MPKPSYFSLRRYFDFNSAYGQLLLLIFIPVAVLASVGSYLVLHDTSLTVAYEQESKATAILMRFEPTTKKVLLSLVQSSTSDIASSQPTSSSMQQLLTMVNEEPHLQRMAIIDASGQVLMSAGIDKDAPWQFKTPLSPTADNMVIGVKSSSSTGYGHYIGDYNAGHYWLFIAMDNEPLYISWLQVLLTVVVTVLMCTLILLLALNIFAKRWIVPIYNMRLHLQQVTSHNLYKPINTKSSGELNLLQQDLVKTLRRLHSDFQELKTHAEQTENDLQIAFDEMEMRNINNRRARDMAVSTSEAKSAFLANISHELRTPLNSIDGFINLLSRHGDLTAEQGLYVETIRKSSAHLLALVNDVLDFSKIEAGKLILDSHEFDLYAAIYDVMDMLSPLASEKGLSMAVLYYNDVPAKITGDALRVKQILTNLVSNAIKFTDSGSVVVRISLDNSSDNDISDDSLNDDGVKSDNTTDVSPHQATNTTYNNANHNNAKIVIAIADTGRGINEAEQAQLFKNFSQVDPSITRQYGGTGLGLVISKQLTRLMGGEIGFYNNATHRINQSNNNVQASANTTQGSTTKQGSTFWFTIPAHVDVIAIMENDVHDIALPTLNRFLASQTPSERQSTQLLAWLTNSINLRVLQAALAPLDAELTQAHSLAGALDKLKEQSKRWDWVIIDGTDTQGDMAALLKQIRLHYQGKLAIFGYQVALDAKVMARYKAHGLYQPLDKRQLYSILDTKSGNKQPMPISQWQGVKVLAVDDHPPNLLVLKALLNELGITVITANSGFDAIDIMSKQWLLDEQESTSIQTSVQTTGMTHAMTPHIDLIFMDLQMPHMSGHEAAKQIREIEQNVIETKQYDGHSDAHLPAKIPIIALSAHGLSDEKDRLIAAGINDYVGKPISQPQLLQILQRWLTDPKTSQLLLDNDTQDQAVSPATNATAKDDSTSDTTSADRAQYFAMSKPHGNAQDSHQRIQSLPIVDWEDALTRSANKPDLAVQLFTMLMDTLTDEINELNMAWENQDREQLAQIAHRILGASRYTGVPQLRAASQDFEDKCLIDVQRVTPVQFAMLQPHFDALIQALHRLQTLNLDAYPKMAQAVKMHKLSENDMTWKMI